MLFASRTNKSILFVFSLLLLVAFMTACGNNENATKNEQEKEVAGLEETGKLVIYTSRKEELAKPVVEKFEKDTGIDVQALYSDGKVINKIAEEKNNVQADLLISNDAGEMEYLRTQGLLESSEPSGVDTIDAKYRSEDNSWIGLSARSRIFMYNKDLIKPEELPQTIEDLADDKYNKQFMITRGGNGSMVAHVSALRKLWGDEKTLSWLKKIKKNAGAIVEGHSDIRKAVGAGEYKFGLVNNYYYHLQLSEPSDNNVGAVYPDQAEGQNGIFVNAAGVANIKDGPNRASTLKFLEWLLKEENQKEFSFASKEVPVNPAIQTATEATRISEYRTIDMSLSELGEMWSDSKELIEKSGLQLELK
jgi:iron(III) transport system substrate-binding protein